MASKCRHLVYLFMYLFQTHRSIAKYINTQTHIERQFILPGYRMLILLDWTAISSDAVTLLIEHWTCDFQVAGSSPGWAPLRSGLGQSTYTWVPLSPSSVIRYQPRGGVICLAGKVTAGLDESNGRLPPVWLMSPAGWLPRNRDQLRVQRS